MLHPLVNCWCPHDQRVSPAPGAGPVLEASKPPRRRPGRKVCVCSLQNGFVLLRHLCAINPRRSQKGSQTPQPFPKELSSLSLGDFVSSDKGALSVHDATALGGQGGGKTQWRGWDHFARLSPIPQDLLAQFLENCVVLNEKPHLQEAWVGWIRGFPTSESWGGSGGDQDPEQEGD